MKLANLETFVVGNPPPRHGGRYFIFVRVTTTCGISGVGEIYNATYGPDICCAMARDMFARHFEGADPHHIEALFRKSYGRGLHPAARCQRHGRVQWFGDGLLGYRRKGRG